MPPAYHVCLDTNILVRIITQGSPGCEFEHWQKIKELARSGTISLLLPEVVALELQKKWREVPVKIESETKALEKKLLGEVNEKSLYSEIKDIRTAVVDCLQNYTKRKEADSEARYNDISTFLKDGSVTSLLIDHETLLRTERRVLTGGLLR